MEKKWKIGENCLKTVVSNSLNIWLIFIEKNFCNFIRNLRSFRSLLRLFPQFFSFQDLGFKQVNFWSGFHLFKIITTAYKSHAIKILEEKKKIIQNYQKKI